MTIAIDFDGTIIEGGNFPNLGPSLPGAFETLKKLKRVGHKLILWTCRGGESLALAVKYCRENGLEFDAINNSIEPYPGFYGTSSRKIIADVYIDDMAWPCSPINWDKIAASFNV